MKEWGCQKPDGELFLSERTSGTKWRGDWGEGVPVTDPNWHPAQGDTLRPDTIAGAVVCLQMGA